MRFAPHSAAIEKRCMAVGSAFKRRGNDLTGVESHSTNRLSYLPYLTVATSSEKPIN